jgi:hypothetical protein
MGKEAVKGVNVLVEAIKREIPVAIRPDFKNPWTSGRMDTISVISAGLNDPVVHGMQ